MLYSEILTRRKQYVTKIEQLPIRQIQRSPGHRPGDYKIMRPFPVGEPQYLLVDPKFWSSLSGNIYSLTFTPGDARGYVERNLTGFMTLPIAKKLNYSYTPLFIGLTTQFGGLPRKDFWYYLSALRKSYISTALLRFIGFTGRPQHTLIFFRCKLLY